MDVAWHEFEKVLIALQGKIETIEEIQKQKGETFNIFSILNMERREVETHSALIYDLINPNGSHSQGNKYLVLFVEKVLGLEEFDFTNTKVKREDPTDEGRRIDFTIENNKYYIVIEMKIDAGDKDKQLVDYKAHANNQGKKTIVYYLTLDGRDASEKSTKDKVLDYTRISFALEIVDWIEACIEKSATLPIIRESLIQYANLIKKITGQTTEEVKMQVVDMIKTPEMAKAATEMAQNLGYVWALKEAEFWHTLWMKFEEEQVNSSWENMDHNEILLDENNKLLSIKDIAEKIASDRVSKVADFGFRFYNKEKKLTLEIYQRNQNKLKYWLFGEKFAEIKNKSEKIKIDKIGNSLGFTETKQNGRQSESKINLKFYGKNVSNPTYELFDNDKLNEFVKNVADEIRKHLNNIDESIKSTP